MNGLDSILVAKYIIMKCEEGNIKWNITKIQKLLYACHGVFLAIKNKSLLKNELVALPFGPVDYESLEAMQDNKNLFSYDYNVSLIPIETCAIIDNVINEFGNFSANQLVNWSHEKDSPWDQTRLKHKKWGAKIPNYLISKYFETKIVENVH